MLFHLLQLNKLPQRNRRKMNAGQPSSSERTRRRPALLFLTLKKRIHFFDHLEGIGNIHNVGFAAGPAAVGVERDGAPLSDESPAYDVRLLTMAAGGKSLSMSRSRAGLPDLIHVGEEG